jgi:glycosyltransferase involved in cell wall biosynthesis
VILGVEGQAQQLLEDAQAGIAIEPENADALVRAIEKLVASPALCQQLGHDGRAYILEKCSRRKTADIYLQVLDSVVDEWSQPHD